MFSNGTGASCMLQLLTIPPVLRVIGVVLVAFFALFVMVFVPAFSFLFWMRRDIRRGDPEDAEGLERDGEALLRAAGRFFELLYCYCLIYFWLMRYHIRNRIARYTTIVFVVAGAAGIIEKALPFLRPLLVRYARLDWASGRVESFLGHWFIFVPLLCIEFLLIRHHLREPAHHHMERTTLVVLRKVLTPLSQLNMELSRAGSDSAKPMSVEKREELTNNYYAILSRAMVSLFQERRISDLNISIMRFKEGTGFLEVEYENDPNKFDHSFRLKVGEGNAGKAYLKKNPFYIPLIRYKHAVELVPQEDDTIRMMVRKNVYKASKHPFKTMLSVPILHKELDIAGVVNLSSSRKSAFRGADFDIASLVAAILGLMNQ